MKNFLSFFFLFWLFSCSENGTKNNHRENYFDSIQTKQISVLDSLDLSQFNDSAKWLLYTIHCDDSCLMGSARNKKLLKKIPLSFLPLKLVYISKDNDTLSLLYNFIYDNDSTIVESLSTKNKMLSDGVVFNLKDSSVIGYIRGEGIYNQSGPNSRYEAPLKPDVKAFLIKNKSELNSWLRKEAIRRKVIPQ